MDDQMKLDLEEAMQRIRRFCELRPSYPDYAMIAHSDYSDAIRMGHLRALCVPPEVRLSAKELDYSMRLHGRILILRERLKSTQLPDPQEITKELHALEWAVEKITTLTALFAPSPQLRLCNCPGACKGYATLSKGVTCAMHVPESIARPQLLSCPDCGHSNTLNGRIVHGPICPAREPQHDGDKNVG